jgi:hypothetical protein
MTMHGSSRWKCLRCGKRFWTFVYPDPVPDHIPRCLCGALSEPDPESGPPKDITVAQARECVEDFPVTDSEALSRPRFRQCGKTIVAALHEFERNEAAAIERGDTGVAMTWHQAAEILRRA